MHFNADGYRWAVYANLRVAGDYFVLKNNK